MINLYNTDCMEFMKNVPDKAYDLAIVDPPYGISVGVNGIVGVSICAPCTQYKPVEWDFSPPNKIYFDELRRISLNQVIFGANHFISKIPLDSSCWIVWDKDNSGDFADCELAWTSFKTAVRKYTFRWNGMLQGNMKDKEKRIHPTQKPVALYKWILSNYAKAGDKILDTHGGSMSIAIACHDLGFDLDVCEIDKDYFEAAKERLEDHQAQMQFSFTDTKKEVEVSQ